MPPEITSRICRDELLQILETEAPAKKQRTTARMPAVTLTGLLCLRDDEAADPVAEPPPVAQSSRRLRANTVPAPNRASAALLEPVPACAAGSEPAIALPSPVLALGTERDLRALSELPTERRRRSPRPSRAGQALDLPPLNASEIAGVLERLREQDEAELAAARAVTAVPEPTPARTDEPAVAPSLAWAEVPVLQPRLVVTSFAFAPLPLPPTTMVRFTPPSAPALSTFQLATLPVRSTRPLVIAASCIATLVLALLVSLL